MPHLLLSLLILLSLMACSRHVPDRRLSSLEQLAESDPKAAYDSLAKIPEKSLSEEDRHYRDFLSVKISDKAYVAHESDSLVKRVLSHEESHQENGRYAEALYYGGRVYSDLGDYPTALDYYQDALDILPPEKKENLELRSRVASQTGRLLNSLRLYEEAIPYVKESIGISRHFKDTLNEVYDLQLLASIYLRSENYPAADSCLNIAISKKSNVPASVNALTLTYLAESKYYKSDFDSALLLIRDALYRVAPSSKYSTMTRAARIYLANESLDTARLYAYELIYHAGPAYQKSGYQILLSDGMKEEIDNDSIKKYISDYKNILESSYDSNDAEMSMLQQSYYNYSSHLRAREKAEKLSRALITWIIILGFCLMSSFIIILMLKNQKKGKFLRLISTIINIDRLYTNLGISNNNDSRDSHETPLPVKGIASRKNINNLRIELRDKLYKLYQTSDDIKIIPPVILKSESYTKLQEHISQGKPIDHLNEFWNGLEQTVLQSSPDFKSNLLLLVGGKLTSNDMQTALLIKCGVSLADISKLLNRSRGAITSRRETMGQKVFDKKMSANVIDGIIMLL